jgi:hypothetical protein
MKILIIITIAIVGLTCITGFSYQSRHTSVPQRVSPGLGGITGYVFDVDGKPVANAEVYVEILDGAPFVGMRPTTETDKDGKFFIGNAKPGLNRILALKEEDGYPDTSSSLYQTTAIQASPEIVVIEGQIIDGVIIRLGQKCEKLSGSVIDAETGKPVKYATIKIYRADDPNIYIHFGSGAEGKFERLLPPVTINIKVTAQDYEEARDLDVRALMESVPSQIAAKNSNRLTIQLHRTK